MYGRLTVICGPMFAGKTTELLKRILWARNGERKDVLVLKTEFDVRYSHTEVITHDGLAAEAVVLRAFADVEARFPEADLICLDEVQFFQNMDRDVVEVVKGLLESGIDVVAAGLDTNWKGEPFAVTGLLMAMADEVVKLRAHCAMCGQPAHKSFKKTEDQAEIQLGHGDVYEPRCNRHWFAELPLIAMARSFEEERVHP
ncbi:MAG: hypothetical protein QM667_08170 [Asticcacaulis sp.]